MESHAFWVSLLLTTALIGCALAVPRPEHTWSERDEETRDDLEEPGDGDQVISDEEKKSFRDSGSRLGAHAARHYLHGRQRSIEDDDVNDDTPAESQAGVEEELREIELDDVQRDRDDFERDDAEVIVKADGKVVKRNLDGARRHAGVVVQRDWEDIQGDGDNVQGDREDVKREWEDVEGDREDVQRGWDEIQGDEEDVERDWDNRPIQGDREDVHGRQRNIQDEDNDAPAAPKATDVEEPSDSDDGQGEEAVDILEDGENVFGDAEDIQGEGEDAHDRQRSIDDDNDNDDNDDDEDDDDDDDKAKESQIADVELAEIKHDLQELSKTLDSEFKAVRQVFKSLQETLKTHNELARVAATFEADADCLTDFKRFIDDDADFDKDNKIVVNEDSKEWAEEVLDVKDGVRSALDSINSAIVGMDSKSRPILEVYMNGLRLAGHADVMEETEKLAEALDNMGKMGYSLWAVALGVAGRSDEKESTVLALYKDRSEEQQEYLSLEEHFMTWPTGKYGLVKSAKGCPEGGSWTTGSRYHDTEDSANSWTPADLDKYISGSFQQSGIKWEFCMHDVDADEETDSTAVESWPEGKYCIFAGSETCPKGFHIGWLKFDDVNDSNGNRASGSKPHGDYGVDTRYDFCCRTDGDVEDDINLPLEDPFVLFPLDGQRSCQRVKYMTATELSLHWDCEDDNNHNARDWPYAREDSQAGDMNITMCYYN